MNLLQKQGFFNSIILYVGYALGFFNLIILFNRFLTIEQIGFFSLLFALSGIYAQVASVGTGNIILRYYPYYRDTDREDKGFVTFISLFALSGFIVVTLLFVVFKAPVIKWYQAKPASSLLVKYYGYIIPIAFFTLVYTLLEAFARAVFKNVLSAFLKEVLLRVFTSVSVLLIAFKLADYHDLVVIYLCANAVIAFILWFSIYRSKNYRFNKLQPQIKESAREMIGYGFFAVLSGSSFALIQNIDVFSLSAIANDAQVGIYSVFFGIAIVISMPAKALSRTSYQIISNAWKDNDLIKIGKIYHKTSQVQALIGCLLLIGLIANHQNIIILLHKPQYGQYFNVFIIIGIASLVDITGGLNSHIISSSRYYKLVMYVLLGSVFMCILLNVLLIPRMGMVGAAIAYLSTMFFLNFIYWFFIKIKLGLQPFDKSYLLIIFTSAVSLLVGINLPMITHFFVDIIYRSLITGVLYISLAYLFKISDDINIALNSIFQRLKTK